VAYIASNFVAAETTQLFQGLLFNQTGSYLAGVATVTIPSRCPSSSLPFISALSRLPNKFHLFPEDLAPNPHLKSGTNFLEWADSFRYTQAGKFSAPFHFIDAEDNPPSSCGVTYSRDCGEKGCVVGAISNYVRDPLKPRTR
jgi:hypothetical protein